MPTCPPTGAGWMLRTTELMSTEQTSNIVYSGFENNNLDVEIVVEENIFWFKILQVRVLDGPK
jgi:hypothetical protein